MCRNRKGKYLSARVRKHGATWGNSKADHWSINAFFRLSVWWAGTHGCLMSWNAYIFRTWFQKMSLFPSITYPLGRANWTECRTLSTRIDWIETHHMMSYRMLLQSLKCIQLYKINGQVSHCTGAAFSLSVSKKKTSKISAEFLPCAIKTTSGISVLIQEEFQFTGPNNLLPRLFCGELMRSDPRWILTRIELQQLSSLNRILSYTKRR